MKAKEMNTEIYRYHHKALTREYTSRKADPLEADLIEYKGKFGEGYVLITPNLNSSRYSWKLYYIKRNE